jgi:hypothetical protein
MDEFVLWMQSLDPVAVAANNSFHSQNHRDEMKRHELDKRGRVVTETHLIRVLVDVGQMWADRDLKALKKNTSTMQRIENNPIKEETTA